MLRAGSGSSRASGDHEAGLEAAAQALGSLDGAAPQMGYVFASPKHDLRRVLAAVESTTPGLEVIGCSTAGEMTERGLTHGGVAMLLVAGTEEDLVFARAMASGVKASPDAVVESLTAGYPAAVHAATAHGLSASTTVLLIDGLAPTGERVVQGVLKSTRAFQQIVGGAAGDEGAFKATSVGTSARARSDAAAAIHVFGKRRWGVGAAHGMESTPARHEVTRADETTVREIDGRPAFDLYVEHARKRGVALTRANAASYLASHELGMWFFDEVRTVRAPLAVNPDGSLLLAAPIATGASICILDAPAESMILAAEQAAREALAGLGGHPAAAVLVFGCTCRELILKDRLADELAAIRRVFPGAPLAGFLTYGEIARFKGRLDGWHNATAVVVAIPR